MIPPEKFSAPASEPLLLTDEQFLTETAAGPLLFLPLLEQLGVVKAIAACGFPRPVRSVMSSRLAYINAEIKHCDQSVLRLEAVSIRLP